MNSLKDNLKAGKTVVGASGSTNVENMLMLDSAGFISYFLTPNILRLNPNNCIPPFKH